MPRKHQAGESILDLLEGGDRRSIGRADEVAAMVSKRPSLFPTLIAGLWSEDLLVRMRAADALEKITRIHRELLQRHKEPLLGLMAEATQQELRWHLAGIIPRLQLIPEERQRAISYLKNYLEDRSSIVKTCALQGLADLARNDDDPAVREEVEEILRAASRYGTPAMKARSRKLLSE